MRSEVRGVEELRTRNPFQQWHQGRSQLVEDGMLKHSDSYEKTFLETTILNRSTYPILRKWSKSAQEKKV